tara:strand:+ start:217 stop:426 length:210 start_codon:yes stop_codon:yes gene_type:complete
MRKNYYGRRRWNSNTRNNKNHSVTTNSNSKSAFAKYKELLDRASKANDPIEKINLQQSAEHWLKVSKEA